MSNLMLESDRPPNGELVVKSPYDERELGRLPTADGAHVEDALAAAQALHRNRDARLPIPQRIEILARAAELMRTEVDALASLAASEGGKPFRDSKVEALRAINGVQLCINTLRSHAGTVVPLGTTAATARRAAFTQAEPAGVVAAISAFNHPLNLIVHQAAPAVATGCPVIVKPAGDTPLSCVRFIQILREAGLPDAWAQVLITDDNDVAGQLVTDPRVAFFSFIGSARVGWMLRSRLARGTRCTLEHGGVAPVILAEPFDTEPALEAILKGGFYHAGQVCVSVQRVYAPQAQAESFARLLAERAGQLIVGAPEDESTDVGPLIRPAEVDRVAEWVDEAVDAGAQLLCGGKRLAHHCYAPTVLLNPPDDAKVSRQEVFGPVVCIYSEDDPDTAAERANALDVSFQAAVFTQDIDRAMRLFKRLDAAAVMINDHTAFRDDVMPFGGLRESGLGVGGIPYTMADMQIDKLMVIQSPDL